MKENNKFSLLAFFCSLGSKSKIFILFLLGAPFLLVQIFTLKVYANSAVVPVVPEGLTTSGVGSSGVVPGDPSLMYYTLLIALGLKADEVYQVNKADIIDSVTNALNEYDSVNDPSLGDDLENYLEWYDNAKSQNGYVNELSINRSLWDRLNKATSTGLNIRIQSEGPSSTPLNDYFDSKGFENYTISSDVSNVMFSQGDIYFFVSSKVGYPQFYYAFSNVASYSINGGSLTINFKDTPSYRTFLRKNSEGVPIDDFASSSSIDSNSVTLNSSIYEWVFDGTASGNIINKSLGIARPFIDSKANGTYDVLSKSGVINDQTGDLEGDVTMSILSYDKIKDIASDYEDSATDIPVFFPDSRLVPIDIDNPDDIPDSVGIPGDTPQEIVDSLADTFDPSPAEPIVIEPFNYIDQWDPVIPIASESPLVGLPFVMNWVAEQMQITMFLSQFSNTWLVLSTLAVASCLVGLVRIWR